MNTSPRLPSRDELIRMAGDLKKRANALAALAKRIDSPDPKKLAKATAALEKSEETAAVVAPRLSAWLSWEESSRGARFKETLVPLAKERGLAIKMLDPDPLELFLAPFTLRVDIAKDLVSFSLARLKLGKCGASADAVLATHDRLLSKLDGRNWDPDRFHRGLVRAWKRLGGDHAPIRDVLPEIAMAVQSDAWRLNPIAKNFREYSKAQFAWDLFRLRQKGKTCVDGWRLHFGPATGGSTRDKRNLLFVEDGQGGGRWTLTLKFLLEADNA